MYLLFYFFSGFCLLSFEILWIHVFTSRIGSSAVSLALISASFFLYAGLGSVISGMLLGKFRKKWLYGLSELLFALTTLASYSLLSVIQLKVEANIVSKFIYVSLFTAIPFFFSGMGLPFLTEFFVPISSKRTVTGGQFYLANLLGAALGVVTGGFILPGNIGYFRTFLFTGTLNIIIAGLAIYFSNHIVPTLKTIKIKKPDVPIVKGYYGWTLLFFSGFFSIFIEILVVVYFQQIVMPSIYMSTLIFFLFLIGLSLGTLTAFLLRRKYEPLNILKAMLLTTGFCIIASSFIFYQIFLHKSNQTLFFLFSSLTLFIVSGTIYPIAWEIFNAQATSQGKTYGTMGVINKSGCVLGSLVVAFVSLSFLGLTGSFIIIGAGYLILVILLKPSKIIGLISLALVAISIIFCKEPYYLPDTETLIKSYSGASGLVSVIQDRYKSFHIVLNQNYLLNGTEKALLSQKNQAWIPLTISKYTGRIAYIGMGSGISANACLDFPVNKLDVFEIVPEVVEAAKENFSKWNSRLFSDSRCRIITEDGRAAIYSSNNKYDVIVSDLFTPQYEYTGYMYTKDFYTILAAKINEKGIVCQWLPLYQLNTELSGIVINTFNKVFPYSIAIRGNFDPQQNIIGLIGSNQPIEFSDKYLEDKFNTTEVKLLRNTSVLFKSAENFKLTVCFDTKSAAIDFTDRPVNTDDNNIFAFKSFRTIKANELLKAYTYLYAYGNIMTSKTFISLKVNEAESVTLLKTVNSGNNYFAAAISKIAAELNIGNFNENTDKMNTHFGRAKELHPKGKVTLDDLGM